MIYAASVNRTIGMVIAITILVVAALFVLYRVYVILSKKDDEVGSEIELAANRKPYLEDDELETTKLDTSLILGLLLLTVIAVALPFYWLAEPGRQANAEQGFSNRAVSDGAELYAANCTSCHGANGQAGAATVTLTDADGNFIQTVSWAAPAVNTVMSRFSEEEVLFILNYGRNGVMPAWGAPGGGPMTTQQVEHVIDYMKSIQLPLEDIEAAAQEGIVTRAHEVILETETDLGEALADAEDAVDEIQEEIEEADDPDAAAEELESELAEAQAELDAVQADIDATVPGMVEEFLARATNPDAADENHPDHEDYLLWGELIFTNEADGGVYGCARCHTAGWSYRAAETLDVSGEPLQDGYVQGGGAHGPNLTNGVTLERFLTSEEHESFIITGSDAGTPYGSDNAPATGSGQMPGFGGAEDPDTLQIYEPLLTPEQIAAVVAYERSL